MFEYQETQEGSFTFEGMTIPKADGNRHYVEMKARLASGEATLTYFDHTGAAVIANTQTEVSWAAAALAASDVDLAMVQDNDSRGVGLVGDWREYRCALRDYTVKDEYTGQYSVVGERPVSPKGAFEA